MSVKEIKSDPLPGRAAGLAIKSIAHLVVTVSDSLRAANFYRDVLGFTPVGSDMIAEYGTHQVLGTASGQRVVLSETASRPDLSETGVHQAYRVTTQQREAIVAALAAQGTPVKRYLEDRPAEASENFYLHDPDGNRIQLVAAKQSGIDHVCVQVADILWAEQFYGAELGFGVDHQVGWRTGDYVRARKWADGEEDMAPGTRRMDKRYTVMVNRKTVPRCSMQMFFRTGDSILGVYLAHQHLQEPPEEQIVGVPRIAFSAPRAVLDEAAARLSAHGRPFVGPVAQPASSPFEAVLYFKDNGGNFFELCTPRGGASA